MAAANGRSAIPPTVARTATDTITGSYDAANEVMDALAAAGIDYDDVVALLEKEGVDKFNVSWGELVDTVKTALADTRPES